MKNKLLIVALLFSSQLFAQHLNQSGHLITTGTDHSAYKISRSAKGSEVETENLKLKGNSAFKTPHGFITLSGSDENTASTVRIYTSEGKEIFTQPFSQTINFVLSPAKNFCAFHDRQQIRVINLAVKKVKTFRGSNIFSVNDAGQAAYYDEESATINFKDLSVKINESVYRVLFFRGQPLFITKKTILLLKSESPETILTTSEGRIFDAETFGDKLFVSVKKETPGEFVFNSFSSDDLHVFTAEEEIHHPLAHQAGKLDKVKSNSNKPDSLDNELIRDPLYYYQDSVYQPVGNGYDEIQEYSIGSPYLHPGVDLLGTYLQDVYSVKNGYVKAILTTSGENHWRIAISNENTASYSQGYLYAHLEVTSIPYTVGDFVSEGDVIGELVNFPVTGFVHCHFARIGCQGAVWNGDWWTFDNPLSYMTNFFDSIPPQFEKTINNDEFAFRDADGNYLSPDSLYGSVRVISKVYDRVNADWRIDVNKLRYSVSPLAFPQTLLLDSFAYEYNFYNDFYFGGPYYTTLLNTIYSRDATCYSTANYDVRDYYHIVTNSDGNDTIDGNDLLQSFNTLSLPDGSYIFRVTASDPSENTSVDSMIIEIKNGTTTGFNDLSFDSQVRILPNPFTSAITVSIQKGDPKQATFIIRNTMGQAILSKQENNLGKTYTKTIDLNFLPKGIYLLDIIIDGEHTVEKIVRD